jgi:hypothetical protein
MIMLRSGFCVLQELMDKYASETLVQQEEEAKALLGFT